MKRYLRSTVTCFNLNMDVRPAGPDPAAANFNPAAARVSSPAKACELPAHGSVRADLVPAGADSVSSLLKELTPQDIVKLLQLLEPLPQFESAALLDTILRAGQEREAGAVLSAFQKLASLDPQLADKLLSRPELQTVRPELEHLLRRLETVGKINADEKLARAAQLLDAQPVKRLPGWDAEPRMLLRVGHKLVEAGGLSNYAKAQDLAQVSIDALRFLPVAADPQPPRSRWRAAAGPRSQPALKGFSGRAGWRMVLLLTAAILAAVLFFSRFFSR